MRLKKVLSSFLIVTIFTTLVPLLDGNEVARAAVVTSIPNTSSTIKSYDNSLLSVTGFASLEGGVNDRSKYVGTSYYRIVKNEREFLQAILDSREGKVKVIEIAVNLNLGWKELNLSSAEITKFTFISKYGDPTNGYTNPTLQSAGVSKLDISNVNGLTIFSTGGNTIKHVELKLQASSNDIVIRNLNFDEMWQWDDVGNHKEVGWTFIKVNGANNVWLDHCKFSMGADGMVDIENGSSGITFSWCEFGLEANENPASDSPIYKSINYMEQKYTGNQLDSNTSLYYKMRKGGATKNQIMAYAAYHSKCHLGGSGDKDYVNYVDSNGKEYKDGNQRIRLTMAYCRYSNVGQRVPMIRQGVGNMINCYIDDSTHMNLLNNVSALKSYAKDTLARGMNARNGASIAADTCVYDGVNEPIVGAELQGQDTSNMNVPWDMLFKNAYNNSLIVNSQVTNGNGTYTGSSWDNNGNNLFTKGFVWYNKSTINKWAWSSSIIGSQNMSKSTPPTTPFTFIYNYNEKLPYSYNIIPLNDVVSTLKKYSGVGKVSLSATDWLKTVYTTTSTPSTGTQIVDGTVFMIKNKKSNLYMEVAGGAAKDSTNVQQWGASGSATYNTWKVVSAGDGYYRMYSQISDGKTYLLDIASGKTENGTNIQIYSDTSSNAQLFKFIDNNDGTYTIVTKVSEDKSCVEVANASTASGSNVQEWQRNGDDCQKWIMEKIQIEVPTDELLYGDVNSDTKVNVFDYIMLKKYMSGTMVAFPVGNGLTAADVNGDGKVNVFDYIILKKYISGAITKLPV